MGKATYTGDGTLRYGDKPHRKGDDVEAPDEVIAELVKRPDFDGPRKKDAGKKESKAAQKDKDKVI